MIRHTVVFRLKHERGTQKERDFFNIARKLSSITSVKKFEILEQISNKNDFDFGLSMEFADQADYDFYNDHPEHQHFVQKHWLLEVEDFMEIDYIKR